MESKPEDYFEMIGGVVLRRSDLQTITKILLSREGAEVTFESNAHRFSTIDELMAFREPMKRIELHRLMDRRFSIVLTVNGSDTTINAPGIDDTDRGAIARINELLLKRRSWYRMGLVRSMIVGTLGPILVSGLAALAWWKTHMSSVLIGGVAIAVTLWSLLILNVFVFEKFVAFRPEDGERKPIDWRAVGWAVALLIVGSVVTQVGTAIRESLKVTAPSTVSSPPSP